MIEGRSLFLTYVRYKVLATGGTFEVAKIVEAETREECKNLVTDYLSSKDDTHCILDEVLEMVELEEEFIIKRENII